MPRQRRTESEAPKVSAREFLQEPTAAPTTKTRAEGYQVVYANNILVTTGYYDMRLHFNDVLSADKSGVFVEEKVTIVVSPELAKDLHRVLGLGLARYEERFGSLRSKPAEEASKNQT